MNSKFDQIFQTVKDSYESRKSALRQRFDNGELSIEEWDHLDTELYHTFQAETDEALKDDPLHQMRKNKLGK